MILNEKMLSQCYPISFFYIHRYVFYRDWINLLPWNVDSDNFKIWYTNLIKNLFRKFQDNTMTCENAYLDHVMYFHFLRTTES